MIDPLHAALVAYDRELPLIKTLEDRYQDWLQQLCEAAEQRLNAEFAGRAKFEADDDDGIWGLGFKLPGNLAKAGLDVRVWSSAWYGGTPGTLRIGAYLERQLARGMPSTDEVRDVVEAAFAADGYLAPGTGNPDVHDCGDEHLNVGWRDLRIDAPDVFRQLVEVMKTSVSATEVASKAVLAVRDGRRASTPRKSRR